MPAKDPRPELKRQNQKPLNRRAKKLLRQAKIAVDPNVLHALDLAWHHLENGDLQVDERVQGVLVSMMQSENPALVMETFEKDAQGGRTNPLYRTPDGVDLMSPKGLAHHVLDLIEGRMTETVPDFPSPTELPPHFKPSP